MQIILLESIDRVGRAGEIVAVKDGYANNYLYQENLQSLLIKIIS